MSYASIVASVFFSSQASYLGKLTACIMSEKNQKGLLHSPLEIFEFKDKEFRVLTIAIIFYVLALVIVSLQ